MGYTRSPDVAVLSRSVGGYIVSQTDLIFFFNVSTCHTRHFDVGKIMFMTLDGGHAEEMCLNENTPYKN